MVESIQFFSPILGGDDEGFRGRSSPLLRILHITSLRIRQVIHCFMKYFVFQHANVLSFFNNVPETNLSTSEDCVNNSAEHRRDSMEATLGLKWEMGVAKLPGSDIQV